MEHLTKRQNDYALYVGVPFDKAEEISAALVAELGEGDTRKKSAFVRRCIISNVQEPVYQRRVEHALEILAQERDVYGNEMREFNKLLVKALTGCATGTTVEFIGESPEYKKFWEQDDE